MESNKSFRKVIKNSLYKDHKEEGKVPRIVPYIYLNNKKYEQYGVCTWCKSMFDQCLYIDYLSTYFKGEKLYKRSVCIECGLKLLENKTEVQINKNIEEKNDGIIKEMNKYLLRYDDNKECCCDLCNSKEKENFRLVYKDKIGNVCKNCARCFLSFK